MTTLMQFLASPLVHGLLHAMGWTLLHFCWQGTIVAAILWSVLQLLAGRSSQTRYAVACFALLLLVALPLITFAHIASADIKTARTAWDNAIPIDPAMLLQISATDVSAPWPQRMAIALDHRMPWLLALWLAGALFFVVRLNFGLLIARRLKSSGTEAPPAELLHLFESLRRRLGVERAVRLLHSARVQVPTVIGWLRPVVLIPASCLTGLSTAQIEAIFCHELAHVRRHDYLVGVFQSIAEALLFYHPAVWWISKQVRRERECCCDEIAVANGGDVLAYAKALSYLEERRAAFPEFVLGANGGALTMRIKRLLGCKEDAPASQFAAFTLLALMIAVAGSYVATIAHAAQPKAPTIPAVIIAAPPHAIAPAQAAPDTRKRITTPAHVLATTEASAAPQNPLPMPAPAPAPAIPGQPMHVPMSSMQPTYKVMPVYPEIAKAAHVQGPVLLRVTISRSGDIENLSAINGSTMLWSSAIDTVRQWKYKPYLLNGEPQEVETVVLVNFHLAPDGTTKVDLVPDPIRVSAGVISSLSIYKVNPVYPPDAKAAGIQGAVVLRAMLGKDGSVEALQVVSGPPALTPSALDAVKQWTYKPYMLNGQPVEVETTITVNYTLADPSTPQGQGTPNGSSSVASDYNGLPLKKIGGPVSTPMVIYQVEPQFSQEARQAKFMGVVLLNLIVDQNGLPQNVHVLRGVGMGLDMKAIEAVKQYRFKPAMENGKPVAVALNIEVNFQIFDKPPVLPAATAAANSFTGTAGTTGNPTPTTTNPDLVLKKIGGGVSTPIVIHSVSPEYTPEARKAKIEGIVLVNLIVDQRGLPQNVYVVRGIDVGLDEKAVEAVRQYRFKPAMEDGKPVRAELNVEVNFKFF